MSPPSARLRKPHLDTLAIVLLVLCCAFWGFQQILIKFAVAEIPPLWQATLRFWGATVLLWLWCLARGVPLFDRDGTLKAGLLAGLLFAGEFASIYLGLMHTSCVAADGLPVHQPLRRGAAVAARGAGRDTAPCAMDRPGDGISGRRAGVRRRLRARHTGAGQWRGDALGLAAGILWGLTTLTIRSTVLSEASAEKTLFYQVGVTALVAPLLSLGLGEVLDLATTRPWPGARWACRLPSVRLPAT